jgi:hypothetical protein
MYDEQAELLEVYRSTPRTLTVLLRGAPAEEARLAPNAMGGFGPLSRLFVTSPKPSNARLTESRECLSKSIQLSNRTTRRVGEAICVSTADRLAIACSIRAVASATRFLA